MLGIALATAFAGSIAAEGTIAGDQAARSVLRALSPLDREVQVSWAGPVTPQVARQGPALLRRLGLGAQTEVVLMNPVRLSGLVVRPAAIDPLAPWVASSSPVGPCRASCPVLLAGGLLTRRDLSAAGVRLVLAGSARLRSAAPLGFSPTPSEEPLLLTGDVGGLDSLTGLGGLYRTHSWLAELPTAALHSWQLPALEARLSRAQSTLVTTGSQFSVTAPFDSLDAARSQAAAAPRRLLLVGGGALAAVAMFVVLAAVGLRREVEEELQRFRSAGARSSQCAVFVIAEAAWLSTMGLALGAILALVAAYSLAALTGTPAGPVLTHSLITVAGAAGLLGGWLCATAVVGLSLRASGQRAMDLLASAALAGLVAVVAFGPGVTGDDPAAVLLAPLCCVAGAAITFRVVGALLRAGERALRRGPVLARLALIGLARAPTYPAVAIAFVALATGLGGFALAYRATLKRGASDQAADQVPLDALVRAGSSFVVPLDVAPLTRWDSIAGGPAWPVRRTDASYVSGGGTVTVPALGVPAGALRTLHGWRTSDGPAPLGSLAHRLMVPGPVRTPGPILPAGTHWLALQADSPSLAVSVTAELRNPNGMVVPLSLGAAGAQAGTLRARVPDGDWELQAIELDEPAGLEITNGHQNGENSAPATQFAAAVTLGQLSAVDEHGRVVQRVGFRGWRAVGAANGLAVRGGDAVVRFSATGTPGVLRPAQPSDARVVPVLVDAHTASVAGPGGRLALTVDGIPVNAKVVGALRRFPTVAGDAAGFVLADEAILASALEAQAPGQGRPDEVWISSPHLASLRRELGTGSFAQLSAAFRPDIQRTLGAAPIARAVLGTLIAATIISGVLAVIGLMVALLGGARDRRMELDLLAQGLGPRSLRRELSLRMLIAGTGGALGGLAFALVLTPLAVAAVRGSSATAIPRPPLVTVAPWAGLAAWSFGAIAVLAAVSLLGAGVAIRRRTRV